MTSARASPPAGWSSTPESVRPAETNAKSAVVIGSSAARAGAGSALLARGLLPLVRIEIALAQPDALRGHLDQLVVLDVGDRLLERHPPRRGQADRVVLAGRAEVGQLLGLERVDLEVLRLGVLADHHALVELLAGVDEQDAAVLERVERVRHRLALLHADQHAILAALDRAGVGAVLLEQAVHDAGAAGVGEELAVVADQAAARRGEGHAGLAAARGAHVGHLALALGHLLDDRAGELVVDVDHDGLVGLLAAVRSVLEQHPRAADRKLETLAAHGLDQHAELELAAAGDLERVLAAAFGDLDGDVAFGLAG